MPRGGKRGRPRKTPAIPKVAQSLAQAGHPATQFGSLEEEKEASQEECPPSPPNVSEPPLVQNCSNPDFETSSSMGHRAVISTQAPDRTHRLSSPTPEIQPRLNQTEPFPICNLNPIQQRSIIPNTTLNNIHPSRPPPAERLVNQSAQQSPATQEASVNITGHTHHAGFQAPLSDSLVPAVKDQYHIGDTVLPEGSGSPLQKV